jgi:hypothetical protein
MLLSGKDGKVNKNSSTDYADYKDRYDKSALPEHHFEFKEYMVRRSAHPTT